MGRKKGDGMKVWNDSEGIRWEREKFRRKETHNRDQVKRREGIGKCKRWLKGFSRENDSKTKH